MDTAVEDDTSRDVKRMGSARKAVSFSSSSVSDDASSSNEEAIATTNLNELVDAAEKNSVHREDYSVLTMREVGPILLVGISSGGGDSTVFKAEESLRRMGKIDVEDVVLVGDLFTLYVGQVQKDPKNPHLPPADTTKRTAVSENVKLVLLTQLNRSVVATKNAAMCMKVIVDGLFNKDNTNRLRLAAMQVRFSLLMHFCILPIWSEYEVCFLSIHYFLRLFYCSNASSS